MLKAHKSVLDLKFKAEDWKVQQTTTLPDYLLPHEIKNFERMMVKEPAFESVLKKLMLGNPNDPPSKEVRDEFFGLINECLKVG